MIIIGDGGHSRVIQEMVRAEGKHGIQAILDDKYKIGFQKDGVIYASISFWPKLIHRDTRVVIGIGDNKKRMEIAERLDLPEEIYVSVIHPKAIVSPSARIGKGSVIMPNAVVHTNAAVGRHCIINTGAIVEHDAVAGNFAHVSPNAILTGSVTCGNGVHIGASATVIPGKHLGSWSIIGAGSTVIEHIPAYSKAVGSPARIIERMFAN